MICNFDIPIDTIIEPYTENLREKQIIIGAYLFTLISYDSDDLDNRGSVKITSKSIISDTSIENTFFVYSSKSELGFWRLCMMKKKTHNPKLYKGLYDYVQQTFIHLELQNFININLESLQKESHNKCFYDDVTIITEIQNHIDYKNRIIDLHLDIEYDIHYTEKYLSRSRRPSISLCTDPPDIKTLEFISAYLKDKYKIISNNFKFNFNKNIDIEKDINLIVNGKIYECVLVKKATTINHNNNIYLYYLYYDIRIGEINKQKQFIPIFATDINYDKITRFGLYYNYIMLYQYICKCLQYTVICTKRLDKSYPICSTHYSYIGDIYQSLFPFPFIKKPIDKETRIQVNEIKKQNLIPIQVLLRNKSLLQNSIKKSSVKDATKSPNLLLKYIKYKNKYMKLKNNM
jgi:hypothetical protein